MGLVGAEGAALVEHGVHQRGLAVVDVRDDGDIANTRTQDNCPSCLGKTACDRANGGIRNRYVLVYMTPWKTQRTAGLERIPRLQTASGRQRGAGADFLQRGSDIKFVKGEQIG